MAELRVRREPNPAGADREISCARDEDAQALRVGLALVGEVVHPFVLLVPDRLFELRDRREVGSLAHLLDHDSVGQARLGGHRLHSADHHRLGLLGNESPPRAAVGVEVGGTIVPEEAETVVMGPGWRRWPPSRACPTES